MPIKRGKEKACHAYEALKKQENNDEQVNDAESRVQFSFFFFFHF